MPCAGTDDSCNSLISVRSPLGEVHLGAPAKPALRPLWAVIRTFLRFREALAHSRQRRALRRLDSRLLRDIGVSRVEMDREANRSFWIGADREARPLLRSPADEVILRVDEAPSRLSRQSSRILRACLKAAEWLAREQLRHAAREIDPRMLDDLAISDPETARELQKLFGIGRDS